MSMVVVAIESLNLQMDRKPALNYHHHHHKYREKEDTNQNETIVYVSVSNSKSLRDFHFIFFSAKDHHGEERGDNIPGRK